MATMTSARRIVLLALASRAVMLTLMVLSDALFVDLDSSARLQNRPCDSVCGRADRTPEDAMACDSDATWSSAVDELAPWDTVFFVRIARCGYETDMINAFFPLLPGAMRVGAALLSPLLGSALPPESLAVLAALALNAAAFCLAAWALHRLTLGVLAGDEWAAAAAVLFFCANPASVFYSAAYTEALFAAAFWTGLLQLHRQRLWAGAVCLAAASTGRSNGILNVWFVLHPWLRQAVVSRRLDGGWRVGAACALILAPYALMQWHAWLSFCSSSALSFPPPAWCARAVPSVYADVQRRYWDVGFLRFYRKLVRWPRVAQSLPVAALSFAGCWTWVRHDPARAL
ncbi:PIG-V mannosyltransferase, partial [Helicosporidium sp. ATCC 50920]